MPEPKSNTAPRRLTPKSIEALRPAADRYDVSDAASGLVLRVLPSGRKVFRWQVRALNRVVVLGPWAPTLTPAHLTLREAREWLGRLREAREAGEAQLDETIATLHRHLAPPKVDAEAAREETVAAIAEEFYKRRIVPHRRRPEEGVRKPLDLDILPLLGARSVATVTSRDCAAVVERVVDRGAKVHAGKILQVMKQLFRFAEARGYRVGNPAAALDPKDLGVEHHVSDRWLTAEEIPIFWKALDADYTEPRADKNGKVQRRSSLDPATRAALRLLLLTGARTGEFLKAKWDHVDLENERTWTIPIENQKLTRAAEQRAKPFVIPLLPTALALFEQLQELAEEQKDKRGNGSPWVMAGAGDSGHYEEKTLGHALRRLVKAKVLVLPGGELTPHDLRRTMRTHLGKLRVPLHIVERSLNHSLGRIVQTYDVGDYLDERREALEKWDAYVQRLLDPSSSNVVPLPASGA